MPSHSRSSVHPRPADAEYGVPGAGRPTRTQARAAARARAKRRRRAIRTGFLGIGSVAAVAVIAVAGMADPHSRSTDTNAASAVTVPADGGQHTAAGAGISRSVDRATQATTLSQLPGLGPSFLKKIPAGTQQVLIASGAGRTRNTTKVTLYTRTADGGWIAGTTWNGHNARDGWTTDHHAGDLHSPIGVYTLTDAGGLDRNPGTKMPYLRSSAFQAPGTGFEGESLADAFDYVIAINYNHVPGSSPLDGRRPMGASRGGGIWVHVDHGGPTHGCISLPKADMATLLKALDPAKHPVIVMGDAASLSA